MKFTIETLKFQDMVAKAAKGASENKILPITSMLAISVVGRKLTLTTTDTNNTLQIIQDNVDGTDMYAVVPVQLFSKLIARTSVERITITLEKTSIQVKGNGVYSIPLVMEDDVVVQFPMPQSVKVGRPTQIQLTTIKNILATNKPAIGKNLETPFLCAYYMGDNVVTSDETVICFNKMKVFNQPLLISPEMMELLALSSEENISMWYSNGMLQFETSTMSLIGSEHEGKNLYPIEEISNFLNVNFDAFVKLPKLYLQNVLDRLALFLEPYDKNGAYFTFTPDGLIIASKQSKSTELIKYIESVSFKSFACCVDIPMFKAQLDACPGDAVELHYGNDAAVKLKGGNIEQIISLLEDEAMAQNASTN